MGRRRRTLGEKEGEGTHDERTRRRLKRVDREEEDQSLKLARRQPWV